MIDISEIITANKNINENKEKSYTIKYKNGVEYNYDMNELNNIANSIIKSEEFHLTKEIYLLYNLINTKKSTLKDNLIIYTKIDGMNYYKSPKFIITNNSCGKIMFDDNTLLTKDLFKSIYGYGSSNLIKYIESDIAKYISYSIKISVNNNKIDIQYMEDGYPKHIYNDGILSFSYYYHELFENIEYNDYFINEYNKNDIKKLICYDNESGYSKDEIIKFKILAKLVLNDYKKLGNEYSLYPLVAKYDSKDIKLKPMPFVYDQLTNTIQPLSYLTIDNYGKLYIPSISTIYNCINNILIKKSNI